MPAKLYVPDQGAIARVQQRLRLRVRHGERPQRDKEAQMFVVLICTTLWGLFWFYFVVSILFNLPALYWLSGGLWYPPAIDLYIGNSGPFPWPLAKTFVFISVFASFIALLGSWLWTVGVYGKWRMRFAVLIFCVFPTGWSVATLKAEGLRQAIARERMIWHSMGSQYESWGNNTNPQVSLVEYQG